MKYALLAAAALVAAACSAPTAPQHRAPAIQAPAHTVTCWTPSGYIVFSGDKCPPQ